MFFVMVVHAPSAMTDLNRHQAAQKYVEMVGSIYWNVMMEAQQGVTAVRVPAQSNHTILVSTLEAGVSQHASSQGHLPYSSYRQTKYLGVTVHRSP